MDNISKFLSKLTDKERSELETIIKLIISRKFDFLDIKKLTNEKDLYRVGKWNIRIVFRTIQKTITIVNIDYRWNIYK